MDEKSINRFLQKTRKLADSMKDKQSGDILLNVGTQLFDQWALANNYKNNPFQKNLKRITAWYENGLITREHYKREMEYLIQKEGM